jgi:glycosyltransferase involved in cell wall biosynthesis
LDLAAPAIQSTTCADSSSIAPDPKSPIQNPKSKLPSGILCFGGVDYWYHNRGHYDLQMMREFSAHLPVLYVNSIGMRVPQLGEGRVFIARVRRKLKSLRRGFVQVRPNFFVYSPLAMPGRLGAKLTRRILPLQIRRAARRAGLRNPLLWIACPPGAQVIDQIPHSGLIYQRTDRFEAFNGVDPERIRAYDRDLKARADLTLYCSRSLHAEEAASCRKAAFVDHGVDYDQFLDAGEGKQPEPADLAGIPHPRIGFVGGIDAHTFDPPLFSEVARACPDLHFILVGGCSLGEGWCDLPNVHHMGRRDYSEVAAYMAACDVLIMPWNASEWIRACNPVKLKEYLAVGRPIVSTPFDELEHYRGLVHIARTATEFIQAIRSALESTYDPAPGRQRVRTETWTAKSQSVQTLLQHRGVPIGSAAPTHPS